METIYLPNLANAPLKTESFQFREYLPSLQTLTPVQGKLQVTHQGTYIEVSVEAETIVTLTCHRCLQQYNHRLKLDTSEMIWLEEDLDAASLPAEREVSLEDLTETLSPKGYFATEQWLYEQLCLALPVQQLCDTACEGIPLDRSDADTSEGITDSRWAALAALKEMPPN